MVTSCTGPFDQPPYVFVFQGTPKLGWFCLEVLFKARKQGVYSTKISTHFCSLEHDPRNDSVLLV